ncbi:ATP synthase subunit I [Nannocystis radixulma]|uniref:ATP synthase subunit I n=1 Tax=Nannocystis radixulma TaxID=2995305 RepID=A0ABT5BA19_9BACT|nr:ATP synthase subunit I [Nannocystis radixulma]MDC0669892.1 ATP synthase subunit I [Nannocystis radixulma]
MRPATWDLVRRRVYLWTLTLTVIAAGLAGALAGAEQAWSVVAGAAIGFLNLASLARAVVRLVAEVQADPQRRPGGGGGAGLALVRWPVAALATVAVLWYMPGRPEGLATGVLAALAAFCLAALQSRADLSSDDPEPDA